MRVLLPKNKFAELTSEPHIEINLVFRDRVSVRPEKRFSVIDCLRDKDLSFQSHNALSDFNQEGTQDVSNGYTRPTASAIACMGHVRSSQH